MTLPNNPIFDFSLSGVSTDLSLGKNGPRLLNSNGAVEVNTFDGQLGNVIAGQGFFANVGIGSTVAYYPLDVYGNIHIGNTATISGIVFADGTFQNTAGGGGGRSFGYQNTIQIAGNNNTFSGSSGFSFDILGNLVTLTGNLQLVNTASTTSGILFPDGSFQDTAAANTPSFGPPGTMQFAGAGNTFSGNASELFWSSSNATLISSSMFISSNTATSNYGSGALVVQGGASVNGNLYVTGNIFGSNITVITGNTGVFYGDTQGFGAIYGGIPMGYVYQPNTVLQLSANVNDYAQFNIQNINPRFAASTDIVATADNGTANDGYIDLGINSSQFFQATIDGANDGYLYVAGNATTGGGNLVIGTLANNDIIFGQGGADYGNEVARFVYGQGLVLELNTASYSPTTGALITAGGLGVAGNGNFAGNLSINYGNTGQVSIGNDPNGRLEIGQQGRASSGVPYIDFHSAAGSGDYDTRIQSSGGNAAQSGQGTLNLIGALVAVSSNLQAGGQALVNSLSSNAGISGANLHIAGTAYLGNVYSNGFSQVAGISITNSLIANANITGANINIAGTAWAGNVYSNGSIQATGLAVVNQLISNSNITGANLNIAGTAWAGNVYSNGFSQTAGLAVVNALISNTNIFGTNLTISGPATVGSLVSNSNIQAAGTATVNALYSNTLVQTANLNATGSATVNSLVSNLFIQTPGSLTANSVSSNSTVQAVGTITGRDIVSNASITAGTSLLAGNITSNSTIQGAGTATFNALVSNTNIYGANLNVSAAAQVNSLISNTTAQIGGLATVNSLIVNANTTTNTLVVQNGSQVGSISSNSAVSANGLISGQQIRSNGFIEGQTLKTTGLAVVNQLISNTEATASTLNITTAAVVQTLTSNTGIQAAGSLLVNAINSNLSITSPAINALNTLSSNAIVSNVAITAANIAASGVVTITNNTASGSTGSGALVVTGGVGIGGNLNVGGQQSLFAGNLIVSGDFIVRGNSTIVNSNTIAVTGPTIEVGSDNGEGNTLTYNDGFDRGVVINYFILNDNNAFMGFQNSTGRFVYLTNVQPGVSNVVNPFESVPGYVYGTAQFGTMYLSNTTVSINSSTGALVVSGGVGIAGDVNTQGQIATTGAGRFGQDLLANQLNSNAAISAVGTITGSSIHSNNEVSSTNISATNTISAVLIAANSMVTSTEMTATDYITGNVLVGNLAVISPNVQATNLVTATNIIANSSIVTTTLVTSGQAQVDALNSNTNVSATNISAVNSISANVITANVALAVPSLTVSGTITGNNLVANNSVGTTELYVADVATVNSLVSNTSINTAVINSNFIFNNNRIETNGIYANFASVTGYVVAQNIYSNNIIQAAGPVIANGLISNSAVNTNTLNATGLIQAYEINSNTTINAVQRVTADSFSANNTIIANNLMLANVIVANNAISTAGVLSASSIYSNTFIQTATLGQFGSMISNSTIESVGAVIGGSIYSNTSIQAGTSLTAQNITSNSTIQSAGTTTVNDLVSNTTIQATGNATVGNLITDGSVTLTGPTSNIIGVNTLFTENVIATGFINSPSFTSNTFISNSNIGIGTSTVRYPLDVYGNIHIGNTATTNGIVFPDGTFQDTAATNTPSYGPQYTIQFAGNANTFGGDSTNLFWDVANVALYTANLEVQNTANVASLNVGLNIKLGGNINGSNTSIISGKTGTFIGGSGGFGALYAGVQDYTNYQPNTIALFAGNVNATSQINVHNDSNGGSASADVVVTANNGNATDTYIDLGINSSGWNQSTIDRANDGYLFMYGNTSTGGGNLVLGTMLNNDIVFTQGGNAAANQVARFVYGQGLLINSAVNSANLSVASLVTNGGVAIGLNALVGGNITASYGTAGTVTVGGDPNGSIEIGQQGRATPGTPYIDFHSSASLNDYDARIQASGGSAAGIGQANLTLFASNVNVDANLAVYGNLYSYTANIGSFSQINSRGIANVQVLQSNGYVSGNTWVIDGNAINSNTTFQQTVDAWSISSFRSAHYLLQITDSTASAYQASQLMLIQNGTDVFFTEYADIYTSASLGSWSADIVGGMVELLFTPYTSDNMSIKVVRTAIDL